MKKILSFCAIIALLASFCLSTATAKSTQPTVATLDFFAPIPDPASDTLALVDEVHTLNYKEAALPFSRLTKPVLVLADGSVKTMSDFTAIEYKLTSGGSWVSATNNPQPIPAGTSNIYWRVKYNSNWYTSNGSKAQKVIVNYPPCSETSASDYDGNTYNLVRIATNCWTKSNLKAKHYTTSTTEFAAGDPVLNKKIYAADNNNDTVANLNKYGYLYSWYSAVGIQENAPDNTVLTTNERGHIVGICPDGWHLPTAADYRDLFNIEANALRSNNNNWMANPGSNTTGMSIEPGGYYSSDAQNCIDISSTAYFWTSEPANAGSPQVRSYMCDCFCYMIREVLMNKNSALSVRCVKEQLSNAPEYQYLDLYAYGRSIIANSSFISLGSDITKYKFCVAKDANMTTDLVCHDNMTTNYDIFTELIPGTTYYVQVTATNAQGETSSPVKSIRIPPVVPTVTTGTISDILSLGAKCINSNIPFDGGESVTARGVCWSTSATPTIADAHTNDGTGSGDFNSELTGLTAGTTYYVRAYATNSIGTDYGTAVSFTTRDKDTITFVANGGTGTMIKQLVPYGAATAINNNQFTHDGNWQFLGWNDACDGNGTAYANGANITTTGNVTLYAQWHTWCTGTAKSNELGTARIDSVKDHQNNWYKVVEIGTGANKQCWLAENMRCTTSPKGYLTAGGSTASYKNAYYYDNTEATQFSLRERGYYYNWVGALDTNATSYITASFTCRRGICPEGWHLPTDMEWKTLEKGFLTELDGTPITDTTLNKIGYRGKGAGKFTSGCEWKGSKQSGSFPNNYSYVDRNTTGFSALPAGYCDGSDFQKTGEYADFWSATSFDTKTWLRAFHSIQQEVNRNTQVKTRGYSVRCVRNYITDTITFMPNGGLGTMEKQVITRGVETALSNNTFKHNINTSDSNWVFIGWSTAANDAVVYANGANITTNGNDTLYAVWHTWCSGNASEGESGTGRVDSVKDADNNWYQVVQIGNQCWLKENLRTTKYANGTDISNTSPSTATSTTTAYWYYPNGNSSNVKTFGLLYNWPAVMNGSASSSSKPSGVQGVCPTGWHVPSNAEFTQLTDNVKIQSAYQCNSTTNNIAKSLASTTGWASYTDDCTVGNNSGTNNTTGFSVVPAGRYNDNFGNRSYLWSTTQPGAAVQMYSISKDSKNFSYGNSPMHSGYSVRCVRDIKDTITFMPNGGLGTMEKQVITRGTATALNANQFTRTESLYQGWNTNAEGSGTHYADGATITTNGNDTLYAEWFTTCGTDKISDIDGNTYNTVKIGNQCWTKENLKTTRYANGESIQLQSGTSMSETQALRYYPGGISDSLAKYGYIYNWIATMDSAAASSSNPSGVQGVCPNGWHVPSYAEFTQLTNYVSSQSQYVCGSDNKNIAKALASTTGWASHSDECAVGNTPSDNNATGFTFLPASTLNGLGYTAFSRQSSIWATDESTDAEFYLFNIFRSDVKISDTKTPSKGVGAYVRCVRDFITDTITFMPNGGLGTMEKQVVPRGVETALSNNTFKHNINTSDSNWVFIGWSTDGFHTVEYANGANITTNGNDTLYAVWHTWCTGTPRSNETGSSRIDSVKDVDNNYYKVVQIGNQCWLKENMKATRFANGDNIQLSDVTSASTTQALRYYPNGDTNNVATYGYFYNWTATTDSATSTSYPNGVQGICPNGWHVPSTMEWNSLKSSATYGHPIIVKNLTSTTGWKSSSQGPGNNQSENNASGFSDVPAGYYSGDAKQYSAFSESASLWMVFIDNNHTFYNNDCNNIALAYNSEGFNIISDEDYGYAYPVRCVRNVTPPTNDTITFMPNGATGGTMEKQVITRGTATALNANQFTRTESLFQGWNTNANGTGTHYADGATITTNGNDTLYAEWFTTCGTDKISDIDGNTYNTVKIGNQCWTKENLKTTRYANGESIQLGSSTSTTQALRYYPNNDANNVAVYGYLYNWIATMDSAASSSSNPSGVQGVCPNGWHVPSDAEWTQLTNYVSSQSQYVCGSNSSYINKALSSTTGWESSPNTCAVGNNPSTNNATGFSAVPAGSYYGSYDNFGRNAAFWSCTEINSTNADYRGLGFYYANVYSYNADKNFGFTVRCVRKLTPPTNDTITFMPNGATGGTMEKQVITRGTATALSANQFTRTESLYQGWNTNANGTGTHYADGATITTNGNDTLYAEWFTTCGTDKIYDIDGNTYNTVKIGNQCWTKENLKTTRYANGESIQLGSSTSTTQALRYYPDGDTNNVATYGYLYNWIATMDSAASSSSNPSGVQGVCPNGWHVPSDAEWTQLTDYVSSQSTYQCNSTYNNIAKALASTTGWISSKESCAVGNNPSTNNATCFSALPAGYYHGSFYHIGFGANFWSATQFINDGSYAYDRDLGFNYANVYRGSGYYKYYGFSVRCVWDKEVVVVNDTITFMPNGATGGTMEKQVVPRGTATALSANQFTHNAIDTNWAFIGWSTTANDAVVYANGANITTNGNDTLYAVWHTWCSGNAREGESGSVGIDSVKDINNNWYKVVEIGGQCWMKENLRSTKYANGTDISSTSPSTASSTTTAYWNYPGGNSSNVKTFGLLYNWPAVMNGSEASYSNPSGVQGVCPNGWHVPSEEEFTQLTDYVSSQSQYVCGSANAKALASTTRWKSHTGDCTVGNNPSTNNTTGFTALPVDNNEETFFWSTSGNDNKTLLYLSFEESMISNPMGFASTFRSVRCVRNVMHTTNDTITFMPNGGTGTMDPQEVNHGVATALKFNEYSGSNTNWTFIGWNTDALGNGTFFADGANITADSNVTLYAQWHTYCTGTPRTGEMGSGRIDSVKDIDNNWYKVVEIGTGEYQLCWLKENMRTTRYANGQSIQYGGTSTSTTQALLYYPNKDSNKVATYGYLYNWVAAMDSAASSTSKPSGVQGVCPNGWHVPSNDEWTLLTSYINQSLYQCDGVGTIAKSLASTTGWVSDETNCGVGNDQSSNNTTGFTVLPAGFKNNATDFGTASYIWSSTESTTTSKAYVRLLKNKNDKVSSTAQSKYFCLSVRCVRNPQEPE